MGFKSDIEIAQETQMAVINEIAEKLEIHDEFVENYGKYKAKIDYRMLKTYQDKPNGKLILVTAINPTPAGEGKRPLRWAWVMRCLPWAKRLSLPCGNRL